MLSNSNNTIKFSLLKTIVTIVIVSFCISTTAQDIPYLKKEKNKTQLIVNNKPFLMLAGELSNSISGSIEHMLPSGKPLPRKEYSMVGGTLGNDTSKNMDYDGSVWDQMVDLNVNTVLVAISWEMIEPEEGKFNFTVVDAILKGARKKNLKVIPLWFGTWKNGMSSYAPLWVKKDYKRFPRSKKKKIRAV
ncbi:beta-galactosidase [uncultured Maribacter sp.]|uniref:beta-galactosidase n=1 Tax=uncultured Maribacter sp. TaxID=431308 RepID=UPI002624571E|nr:beta-galactosidase [uncultured Maribacter sp.]